MKQRYKKSKDWQYKQARKFLRESVYVTLRHRLDTPLTEETKAEIIAAAGKVVITLPRKMENRSLIKIKDVTIVGGVDMHIELSMPRWMAINAGILRPIPPPVIINMHQSIALEERFKGEDRLNGIDW